MPSSNKNKITRIYHRNKTSSKIKKTEYTLNNTIMKSCCLKKMIKRYMISLKQRGSKNNYKKLKKMFFIQVWI